MASVILTNWTVYYSTDAGAGAGYKQIRWTGAGAPDVATNTVNELYSAICDLFSISAQNDANDTTPMVAVTPTVYQIGAFDTGDREPWFIDPVSVQHLTGGSLQTVLWTRDTTTRTVSQGIVKITRSGTAIVAGDVGATITNGTKDGTLLYVSGTELWIRPTASTSDDDWTTGSGSVLCNGHTDSQITTSVSGERLWSNIYTIGSIYASTTVYVVQNFVKLPSFWSIGHIDRLILTTDGFATGLIDRGLLSIYAREYGYLYDHYDADVSAGGRNPIPLATSADVNNLTASGTIGALTGITFTFGESTHDLANGSGSRKYDVDINCGNNTLANFYEYTKYVTQRTSTTSLNGRDGEQYTVTGINRISFDTQTANFAKTYTLTGTTSGATGIIEANHDDGATGTLIVRDVRGSFVNGETITDNQGTPGSAKILASSGIATTLVVKTSPFGTFAGGSFFGSRGVYIYGMATADVKKYSLIDSLGVTQNPPNSVTVAINVKDEAGANVQSARVAVYKTSDMTELLNATTDVNGNASTTYIYTVDVPVIIRVRKSSASPKYISVNTSGTIGSTGLSSTVTFVAETIAAGTTDGNIGTDFAVNITTKTIRHDPAKTAIYTVNALYTWLMDYFDETAQMVNTIPMSAQTPTEYTFINGWFMNNASFNFLSGGAVQTSEQAAYKVHILTVTGGTYSDPIVGDLTKTVLSGATSIGPLLDYETISAGVSSRWFVRDTRGVPAQIAAAAVMTISTGTGRGNNSVGSLSGENTWSNIFTLGSLVAGTTLDLYQNDVQLTPWWIAGHIDILVKVKIAGTLIDSGKLLVLGRLYGTLYDHYLITAASGRNPVPLAELDDGNNDTASGTVSAYSGFTFTFGYASKNLNNGAGLKPYDCVIECNYHTVLEIYEYLKYVTRTASSTTLNVVNGEFYTAVGDVRFDYDNEGGGGTTFNQGELITGTGGGSPTGYLVSLYDAGTTGTITLRNIHGTFTDNQVITGGTTGRTALVNGTVSSITAFKQAPFGTYAGGRFFGARGVWLDHVALTDVNKYELIDSAAAIQVPPPTVWITINGVVSGDRVSVFRALDANGTVDKAYISSHASSNSSGSTTWTASASIPADTPPVGFVRLRKIATLTEERIAYTGWSGSAFTLSVAHAGGYGSADKAYVPYLDDQSTGTSMTTSVTYVADRNITTRVRKKGIQPYNVNSISLTSSGYTATATRIDDTIAV